jgi:prolipoprotein diacylglyceryltransferase
MYGNIRIFVGARLGSLFFYDFDYYSQQCRDLFCLFKKNANGSIPFIGYAGLVSHGNKGLLLVLYFYSKVSN